MDSNKGEFQYEIYVSHNRKKLSELESLESWHDRIIEKGALIAFAEGEVLVLAQNKTCAESYTLYAHGFSQSFYGNNIRNIS